MLDDPRHFLLAMLVCFSLESLDSQNPGLLCYGACFESEQSWSSEVSPLS